MSRGLEDVRLAAMMLDGLEIAERMHVVALGITTEGVKIPLGLWEEETLTLMRLGIDGQLAKTLGSTNPIESMIEIVRHTQRNVKRWREGDMRKRWTAAGMLVAEQQFRRIIGYRDLAKLVIAVERHALHTTQPNADRQEVAEAVTV